MPLMTEELADGVRVRVLENRLDAALAIRFKDRLREIAARNGPVILLDLSRVDFMDSSGLGAILAIRRTLPPDRRIELTGLTANVERVLRLTRMDMVFVIHPPIGPDSDVPVPAAAGSPQERAP
ncbi:STAS domain-containing protein [Paracoccus endophyticus]|uniref:STAS domain-containing protein n=1 Tax=Paracoccus endophyticus TaxID=2233774 RepID=UPI000DD6BBEA|nr:STAS domain-containing protein [Paracoccus endophyticus]